MKRTIEDYKKWLRICRNDVEENASWHTKELISFSMDKDLSNEIYSNGLHDGEYKADIKWIKRIVESLSLCTITAIIIEKIRR